MVGVQPVFQCAKHRTCASASINNKYPQRWFMTLMLTLRTFGSQPVITRLSPEQKEGFRAVAAVVHKHGAAISMQLTHGGGTHE